MISGLSGGILENISDGFFDGIKEWYDEWNALPQNYKYNKEGIN